ncbi:MAG: pilus assembly protein TadG-related protein [Armatimonadota bacterium]
MSKPRAQVGRLRGRCWLSRRIDSRGVATVWVAVALTSLLGAAALSIDIGMLVLAAQRSQDVADSAALAGAQRLPYESEVRAIALETVQANNVDAVGWEVACTNADIRILSPGEIAGSVPLGPWSYGVEVTVHGPVQFGFARVLGMNTATAHRTAVAIRGPVNSVPICPMWISANTELNYGVEQELLMADGPHYADIGGSFGFLQPPDGCTADWFTLLEGYGLTEQDYLTSFVSQYDTAYAYTGLSVGGWVRALESDHGIARLERAMTGEWADDTWQDYEPDNPRILLVPMVTYLGDSGSNAAFRIERFAAFWLEYVDNTGTDKKIIGRFIDYFDLAGGDPNGGLSDSSGIVATKLVR